MRKVILFFAIVAVSMILPIHAMLKDGAAQSNEQEQATASTVAEWTVTSAPSEETAETASAAKTAHTTFPAGTSAKTINSGDSAPPSEEPPKNNSGGITSAFPKTDLPKENVIVTINAVGDCTIGYDETFGYQGRFDQVYEEVGNDPEYFFSNVVDIFDQGDITIANLEGVFTESNKKADKTYRFKGPPEYVKILEAGKIDAVSIANNHILDYYERGLNDTKEILDKSTVAYFGYETYKIFNVDGILVGFAGIHAGAGGWEHRRESINTALDTLNREADIVVMSMHWGVESKYQPTGDQRSLARYLIDNGADLVVGHHTHTVQGVEVYKERTVAYSLGNFCFGGNRNPKDKDTMILQQSFEFDGESHELLSVPPPKLIPASLSSVDGRNDYRPTPLIGAEAERVLEKISNGL